MSTKIYDRKPKSETILGRVARSMMPSRVIDGINQHRADVKTRNTFNNRVDDLIHLLERHR